MTQLVTDGQMVQILYRTHVILQWCKTLKMEKFTNLVEVKLAQWMPSPVDLKSFHLLHYDKLRDD